MNSRLAAQRDAECRRANRLAEAVRDARYVLVWIQEYAASSHGETYESRRIAAKAKSAIAAIDAATERSEPQDASGKRRARE